MLSRKLRLGAVAIVLGALTLATQVVSPTFQEYRRNTRSLERMQVFHAALRAATLVSAERGPGNSLMGDDNDPDSPYLARLQTYRESSDLALDELGRALSADSDAAGEGAPEALTLVRQRLAVGRREVDRVAALPRQARSPEQIRQAITTMFTVVDALVPVVNASGARIIENDNKLAGPVILARLMGDLRENAGRIGSLLVPSLVTGQPMNTAQRHGVNRLRGRVEQLGATLEQHAAVVLHDDATTHLMEQVQRRYFGAALDLVDEVVQASLAGRVYPLTAGQFTERIVPDFRPLETLRERVVVLTMQRAVAARDAARNSMLLSLAAVLASLLVLVAILVGADRLVFRPLLRAKREIVELAKGDLREVQPPPARGREVTALFEAIGVLRQRQREALVRDKERQVLSERLRRQAETDALTGLLNRRALEQFGEELSHPDSAGMAAGLILFDIDYFKRINDSHGHLAGDRVLQEVARRVQAMIRGDDILVRYGGEEFAFLTQASPGRDALRAKAEKLRAELQARPIVTEDGVSLTVTCSFGVAEVLPGDGAWLRLFQAADAALYAAKGGGRNRVEVAEPIE